MAHPLAADDPIVWMPALLIGLTDGDPIAKMQSTPPTAGPEMSCPPMIANWSTFDEDAFGTDYHGFLLTNGTTPQMLGSSAFDPTLTDWTISAFINITSHTGTCDLCTMNTFYQATGDAGPCLSLLATVSGGQLIYGSGTSIATLSSAFPTSTNHAMHIVGDSSAGVVRVYRTVSGTTTLMATSSTITVPSLASFYFINYANPNATVSHGVVTVVDKVCNSTELTSVGNWLTTLDSYYVNYPRELKLTDIVVGSEVRIYLDSDGSELDGVESAATSTFTTQYTLTPTVTIVVHKPGYKSIRLEGVTLLAGYDGTTIPINQVIDRDYA